MPRPRYNIPQRGQRAALNLMHAATVRASRLTEEQIRTTMAPLKHCAARIREGTATETQVLTLRTHLLIAREIERLGYVRGMEGHIDAAVLAIKSIYDRGMDTGEWKPTATWFYELDAINSMVDLHDHQLRQLSRAELDRAARRVLAQAASQDGCTVHHIEPEEIGMEVRTA